MEMMIWNALLSAIVAIMGFALKGKFDELDRLGLLLSKTREEIARNHITREEYSRDLERLGERIDAGILRLENKLDALAGRVK